MSMTNTTQSAIASNMLQALNIAEPDLDTSIGTTVRNIIDVCAEQISQASLDSNISQYQYAIDTLSGSALDSFCANFGFQRFIARGATGIVTFTQNASNLAVSTVTIPAGTLVATANGVVFQTISTYSMIPIQGQSNSIDVPVQAVVGGSNSNVASGSIININTPLNGINSVTNSAPTSGGSDAESDSSFRIRFKATALRAFTGTAQSFLGAALDNPNAISANVMGSVVTHSEQVSFSGGPPLVAVSSLTDVGYVYPYNSSLATDLTNSTASAASGSLTLEGAGGVVSGTNMANGSTYTNVWLQATGSSVTLNAGALLTFGTQTAIVSTTTTVSATAPTSVPINSFTAAANFTAGTYAVTWIYNAGDFLTYGVDYDLGHVDYITDPGSSSGASAVGATTGGTLSAGTYKYAFCYANFAGRTNLCSDQTVTLTGTTSSVTFNLPANMTIGGQPVPTSSATGVYAFIYRQVSSTYEFLAAIPVTQGSYVDTGAVSPAGDAPASNTTGIQVQITALSSRIVSSHSYQIQFDYIPSTSRNSYPNILNAVDIYVSGSNPVSAAQVVPFYYGPEVASGPLLSPSGTIVIASPGLTSGTPTSTIPVSSPVTLPAGTYIYLGTQIAVVSQGIVNATSIPIVYFTPSANYAAGSYYYDSSRFNGFSTSPLYIHNFQRSDGTLPTVGNKFIPLAFGPVTTLPGTITSPSGGTYTQNTDYWLINETDSSGMSNVSLCGIEWKSGNIFGSSGTTLTVPGSIAALSVDYSFNDIPLRIDNNIQSWRLLSQDVMVHQAYPVYLLFNLVIVPASGALLSTLKSQINSAITTVLSNVNFGQLLEASTVLSAVLSVGGVANARWATSTDNSTYYAIQSVNTSTGLPEQTFNSATLTNVVSDVQFTNITYPEFYGTNLYAASQNTFVNASTAFNQPL